ncbi:MAG: hypothetical protein M1818_007652 [Claussenomyces sp. TS43310]|nr:MAG: hypothetical protein M1818_007652 [Claussenomyces sp. TS43310]
MLLPSALPCDASRRNAPQSRYPSAALFASPPNSPPNTSLPSSTLLSTCRSLQALLSMPSQLPTPTMMHAPTPDAFKLRLRSRKAISGEGDPGTMPRKKIVKRRPSPRGINKRRRAIEDDAGRDIDVDDSAEDGEGDAPPEVAGPSTPKRTKLTPETLPMGLERSDFLTLQQESENSDNKTTDGDGPEDEWTTEEDRILVELVLEKLKLSKSDWQDCARNLGKDRGSVGRRWKTLMTAGDIGLKRPRRTKIHGTWR